MGHYCKVTVNSDPSLTAGLVQPTAECTAGYYCPKGMSVATYTASAYEFGSTDGGKCPLGYYCEAGTLHPTPCPMGTYGAAE